MDSGSGRRAARTSNEPTAASILGVKGQLRFHPHGSTQKAHVVLRQVPIPGGSDDEGESSMVYFSLFAQKRIEVKPGKEILLAVATPDGKFLDTPVIFAGRLKGDDVVLNTPGQQAMGTQSSSSALRTLPPKMRKTWSKRTHVQAHDENVSTRLYVSLGIQADPSMIHDDTTDVPSSPVEGSESSVRERSLSPMELDSLPSSPAPPSPEPLPEISRPSSTRTKSTSFSPPGLWVSHTSPRTEKLVAEANIPSLELSPDSEEPPGLSFTPTINPPRPPSPKPVPSVVHTVENPASRLPQPLTAVSTQSSPAPSFYSPATVTNPPPPTHVESEKPAVASILSAPYVPKRKIVPNPFVSGGLLTDFVSSAAAGKEVKEGRVNGRNDDTARESPTVASPPTQSTPTPSPLASLPQAVDGTNTGQGTKRSSTPPPATSYPRKSQSPPPSASPSSSKVKVEDLPAPSQAPARPPVSNSYNGPAHPEMPFPFMPPGYPPMAMPNFPPNLTHPPPRLLSRGSTSTNGVTQSATNARHTPPPDSRALAYTPATSYTNPLNIRPTANMFWPPEPYDPHSPSMPLSSSTASPVIPPPSLAPKKPAPIGSGWPSNRQTNGHSGKAGRRTSINTPTSASTPHPAPFVSPIPPAATLSALNNSPTINVAPGTQMNDSRFGDTRSPVPQAQNGIYPAPQINNSDSEYRVSVTIPTPPTSRSETPLIQGTSRPPSAIPSAQPVPARPTAFSPPGMGTWTPNMGVKRSGSPTLQTQSPDSRRPRSFDWLTSDAVYSLRLQSDGDCGIRTISHNSDGSLCAVTCFDKSVRILSTKTRTELAKLAHNMQVTAVAWMERDAGIITLGDNGIVSTWTRSAGNKWQWAKLFDSSGDRRPDDEPCCLAFGRDRIAIAFPRTGVKVWLFIKGTWLPQRSILRQNVTAIKFVEDGEALIGGTTDGVLWYCQVPNGTLRAYSFMKSKVYALDVDPRGGHALAAQTGGKSHLVNISQDDAKGKVEQVYVSKDTDLQTGASYDFGALFANRGRSLLFGVTRGCIMVWDRKSGEITHGLNHGEEYTVQAVSCFDGSQAAEGHILTGTRQGHLTWFSQPPVDGQEGRPSW